MKRDDDMAIRQHPECTLIQTQKTNSGDIFSGILARNIYFAIH